MDRREFVAHHAWLAVGIATLPLTGLAALTGIPRLPEAIAILGWLFVAPMLLLWGRFVAAWLFPEPTVDKVEDPLELLKRRYAEGEIDQGEFEQRLEGLLGVEEADLDRE